MFPSNSRAWQESSVPSLFALWQSFGNRSGWLGKPLQLCITRVAEKPQELLPVYPSDGEDMTSVRAWPAQDLLRGYVGASSGARLLARVRPASFLVVGCAGLALSLVGVEGAAGFRPL